MQIKIGVADTTITLSPGEYATIYAALKERSKFSNSALLIVTKMPKIQERYVQRAPGQEPKHDTKRIRDHVYEGNQCRTVSFELYYQEHQPGEVDCELRGCKLNEYNAFYQHNVGQQFINIAKAHVPDRYTIREVSIID